MSTSRMRTLYRVILLISVFAPILADDSSVLVDEVMNDHTDPGSEPTKAADQVSNEWGERVVPFGEGFASLNRNGQVNVLGAATPKPSIAEIKSSLTCEKGETSMANESREILSGFFGGYLSKLANKQEKQCISELSGCMISDLFTAANDSVIATAVIKKGPHERPADKQHLLTTLLETGSKLMDVAQLVMKMLHGCLNKDALDMLNATGRNLVNIKFVRKAVVVNLVNITELLADSMERWSSKDFHAFGYDLGFTIRKILLTDAKGPIPQIPEGMPMMEVFEKVMSGVSSGFFTQGTTATVYNKADPSQSFRLDLKSCIADNLVFFQNILETVWPVITILENGVKEGQLRGKGLQGIIALFQSPAMQPVIQHGQAVFGEIAGALQKCNINGESKEMLGDLMHSIKNLRIKPDFTPVHVTPEEVEAHVTNATKYWEQGNFTNMGLSIGVLFRELLLQMWEKKYEVDGSGQLRMLVQKEAEHGMFIVGLVLLVSILMSAAIYRRASSWKGECRSMYQVAGEQDPETLYPGSEEEAAE